MDTIEKENKIICIDHLTKDFGYQRGVFDISFNVYQGEVFGFLGPNGAGKTTTIRHIMGFAKPQSGTVSVFGKESYQYYNQILENIGYLPGEVALPENLTGKQFIQMMQELRKAKNFKRLQYLLEKFPLDLHEDVKRMSLGDKRKLAIITAFMNDPDVLILDDIGGESITSWSRDDILLPLLNARIDQHLTTIFISEFSLEQLPLLYTIQKDHLKAEKLISKMKELMD